MVKYHKEIRPGRVATYAAAKGGGSVGSAAVPPTLRTQTRDSMQDAVVDFQDEFLLLEDVLKVGLVRLNEQIIVMMMSTLVYPVFLQPLCLFMLRCHDDSGNVSRREEEG